MYKKLVCFLLCILTVAPLGATVRAHEPIEIIHTKNNFEFSFAVSKLIQDSESEENVSPKDAIGTNLIKQLRIVGRSRDLIKISSLKGVKKCIIGNDNRFVLEFRDAGSFEKTLQILKRDNNVIYAQKDSVISTCSLSEHQTDSRWGKQTLKIEPFLECFSYLKNDGKVTVAVIDSGVAEIDCLKNRLVPGYDFVDGDSDTSNDRHPQSHGTFLASIIAECTEGVGINIMPVRVMSSQTGSLINSANGIIYAVDNGADIINFSIGGRISNCSIIDDAISYAEQNGVLVVVSAGNIRWNTEDYCPTHNESALVVGSIDRDLCFSESFSNYGKTVDLVAPGERIVGYNSNGQLQTLTGTSMSAAFISACAALVKYSDNESNPQLIQQQLFDSCLDLGEQGKDEYYGFGLPQMNVLAEQKEIVKLIITNPPNKRIYQYKTQEHIDTEGLKLSIQLADGTLIDIDNSNEICVSMLDTSSIGIQEITISYKNVCETFDVEVKLTWWQWIIRIFLFGWIWY